MSETKTVRVTVRLKPGVLDPQGEAIHEALGNLGYEGVHEVRVGKVIEMEVAPDVDAEGVRAMAEELLANTVIESFEVDL